MTTAVRLFPKPSQEDFGQCEAERIYSYQKSYEKLVKSRQCKHGAKFEINGHRYCARHAGIVALAILLGEDDGTPKG